MHPFDIKFTYVHIFHIDNFYFFLHIDIFFFFFTYLELYLHIYIFVHTTRLLLIVSHCESIVTNSSFIPSTVKEWNKLDIAIRKLDSLSKFKNAIRLNSQSNKISVPKLITMALES